MDTATKMIDKIDKVIVRESHFIMEMMKRNVIDRSELK
jgi:hypothetical protein